MSETTTDTAVRPCGMWPKREGRECGNPATLGWPSEATGRLVPICDECIARTGTSRRNLTLLSREPAHVG